MSLTGREIKKKIAAGRLDPIKFARGVLGHDLWRVQQDMLRAITTPNSRTAVKACHASSKTFTAAEIALFWLQHDPEAICITTAPVFKQVRLVMWGEIHRMAKQSLIKFPKLNQTELRINEQNYLIGISTDAGINLQGFHGKILVILDEAIGIANDIFEALEGIRAGGDVRILALGNPTVPGGAFYDAFRNPRGWQTITISAFDSPNLVTVEPEVECDFDVPGLEGDDPDTRYKRDQLATLIKWELEAPERLRTGKKWEFLIQRWWVVEKWHQWGRIRHPLWWGRVLGEFPPEAENALFSLAWISAAKYRAIPWNVERGEAPTADCEVGIDVAGPGDDETVIIIRHRGNILLTTGTMEPDPRGWALAILRVWAHRIKRIKIDSDGIGYNFALHIADNMKQYPNVDVIGISVGKRAYDPERFVNLKAQLYWSLREFLQSGTVAGLEDDETESQLLSIQYELTPKGQVKIEGKDDARARGVKSPDRAEALMLAFAPIGSPPESASGNVYNDEEFNREFMISNV